MRQPKSAVRYFNQSFIAWCKIFGSVSRLDWLKSMINSKVSLAFAE